MGEVDRWRQDGVLQADPAFAGMTEGSPPLLRRYMISQVVAQGGVTMLEGFREKYVNPKQMNPSPVRKSRSPVETGSSGN